MEITTTNSSTAVASLSYHFTQEVSTEKCTQWLETLSTMSSVESGSVTGTATDDLDDGSSLITDDCTTDSVGGDSSTWLVPNRVKDSDQVVWNDKTMLLGGGGSDKSAVQAEVNTVFNRNKNIYKNVKINKSKQVHLGNVTYINGPVFIGQQTAIENESTLEANFEVTKRFRMVNRTNWLAQPPMEEKIIFKRSAKYVIVCHTATDESYTQPGNVLQVRLIQQFHVEGRNWDDIAYNYLIGSDGNVYEGRGFDAVGSHTFGYNSFSIGIAFIGFFTKKLPPEIALNQLKSLLEYGVEIGALCPDYKLLAHSQCSTTESPGRALFEELSTWPHFDPTVDTEHPVEEYKTHLSGFHSKTSDCDNNENFEEIEKNDIFNQNKCNKAIS